MLAEEIELKLKELRGEIITSVNKFNNETGLRVSALDIVYYAQHIKPKPELFGVHVTMKDK